MSFSVGIVGLPNVGKSTLFKALTKRQVDIADYPFTTIDPNVGVIQVPDERLKKIAETVKPEKVTPTVIEFVDIAGLVKNAHRGEGLGNQFLAQIRNCDAILEVVKVFGENPTPEEDIETIKIELEMKDLESKSTVRTQEEKNLLSQKPIIYLYNTSNGEITKNGIVNLNLKLEEEISELSEREKKELGVQSQLDKLILACYNILDLITFYTITGGKETRAWTLKKGSKAPQAGGKVHSDFEEKFIRAEVIPWKSLIEAGSWPKAREKGWIKTVGKDYVMQDGDVIEFKI
ncbi:MAG: redox-regulated ATPase YchF [Candidatus Nealsonbacteria bacterium]|nr:MAG: redox-regulated ATPase YchF [Candidatus Nealsonbacteria bacterium]